jgi:CRISPR-associated protein Csd2
LQDICNIPKNFSNFIMGWEDFLPDDIKALYEIHDYNHAAAILANEFPIECTEICHALREFKFTEQDVKQKGGNESAIPKKFSSLLRPSWKEEILEAKLVVNDTEVKSNTHKVDYVKGRVALDLEWNSKDQTFDRDLYAFRSFFEYNRISLGILITRSNELDPWFQSLGTFVDPQGKVRKFSDKYGASTTHMGKLISRLEGGRHGGCPILVFGIQTKSLQVIK